MKTLKAIKMILTILRFQISVLGECGIAGISTPRPPAGKEMCLSPHSLIHKHARNISIKLVSCFQTMGTFPLYFITSFSPIESGIDQRKSALRTIEFETFKTKTLEYYLFRKAQSWKFLRMLKI